MARFSPRFKLALLYSLKRGIEEAAAKYIIPINNLRGVYESKPEIIARLVDDPEFKLNWIRDILLSGYSISDVSLSIDWRDFEYIAAKILSENGYDVHRNYRIKEPRREIDILGVKGKVIVAVDCKNWNLAISASRMRNIVSRHLERTSHLSKVFRGFKIIPLIVTLFPHKGDNIDNSMIVEIDRFREYIRQLEP